MMGWQLGLSATKDKVGLEEAVCYHPQGAHEASWWH